MEGTTEMKMMIERLERYNGAMADNKEVKKTHLNTKHNHQ
jgi:hypothetical protein